MLKSMVATGGFKLKTQIEALGDSPDIVIATPGRFLQLFNSACLDLDNIKRLNSYSKWDKKLSSALDFFFFPQMPLVNPERWKKETN
mgnify:CR=1 FL=1